MLGGITRPDVLGGVTPPDVLGGVTPPDDLGGKLFGVAPVLLAIF